MLAREILDQILAGATNEMGAFNIVSWRSMDYSETRQKKTKGSNILGNSFIADYVSTLLFKYRPSIALSLRKMY